MTDGVIIYRSPLEKWYWEAMMNNPWDVIIPLSILFGIFLGTYLAFGWLERR